MKLSGARYTTSCSFSRSFSYTFSLAMVLSAGAMLFTTGCAGIHERNLLTVPVVSMTHSKLPKDYRLQSGSSFLTEFCEDDRPIVNTGKVIGLADQAILKAQKKHKATHLLDVRVVREGECVIAEGTTARAVRVEKRSERSRSAMLAPKRLQEQTPHATSNRMPAAIPAVSLGKPLPTSAKASLLSDVDEFIFTGDVLAPDADAPPEIFGSP